MPVSECDFEKSLWLWYAACTVGQEGVEAGRLLLVIIQVGDMMAWIGVVVVEVVRSGCVLVIIRR